MKCGSSFRRPGAWQEQTFMWRSFSCVHLVRLQSPVTQSNSHLGIVGRFEDGTQVSYQLTLSKGDYARICMGTIRKGEGLKSRAEASLNMKFQKPQLSSRGLAPLPDSLHTCLTSPKNCVSQFFVISFSQYLLQVLFLWWNSDWYTCYKYFVGRQLEIPRGKWL